MILMTTPGLWESLFARTVTPRPDCVLWNGATDRGYGRVYVEGTAKRTHRVVWELKHGPIPDGLTIDHLCRVRACLNTEHMELVTAEENNRRKPAPERTALALVRVSDSCRNGHLYPPDRPPRTPHRCAICLAQRRSRAA